MAQTFPDDAAFAVIDLEVLDCRVNGGTPEIVIRLEGGRPVRGRPP